MNWCGLPGCHRPHKARGLCQLHYNQVRRARNPYRPGSGIYNPQGSGHGTPPRYNDHGCRCDPCREAWRRYRAGEWDGRPVTPQDIDPDVVRCLCGCGQEWPRHAADTPEKVLDHLRLPRLGDIK